MKIKTKDFIFDTGVTHDDIDFEQYSWERSRFNKVREGDFLIEDQLKFRKRKFYFLEWDGNIEGEGDRVLEGD